MNYVLGFAFSRDRNQVVLINKPEFINGVGGKVELLESPLDAMYREFEEETGVKIHKPCENEKRMFNDWNHFLTISGPYYTIYTFRTFTNAVWMARTTSEEGKIKIYDVETVLKKNDIAPDLNIIIPLALDEQTLFTEIKR